MVRIILLALAGSVIFAGIGTIFIIPGSVGLVVGFAVAIFGAVLLWAVEARTRRSLQSDTAFNRLMKVEGDDLLRRHCDD